MCASLVAIVTVGDIMYYGVIHLSVDMDRIDTRHTVKVDLEVVMEDWTSFEQEVLQALVALKHKANQFGEPRALDKIHKEEIPFQFITEEKFQEHKKHMTEKEGVTYYGHTAVVRRKN